jgi:acyl carrier protein
VTRTVHSDTNQEAIFLEIADLLRNVITDYCIDMPLMPETSIQADLDLESFDVVRFGLALTERYGTRVNIADYLSQMDFESVAQLTLGDIAEYVAGQLHLPVH